MICSVLPRSAIGHTYSLMLTRSKRIGCLYANLASFVLDYVVRQKMSGTHLTFGFVMQLPVLPPSAYDEDRAAFVHRVTRPRTHLHRMGHRAVRPRPRATTAHRSAGTRTAASQLRAELDAAFFHLYGIDRDDVDYIMETFPIVKRKDIQQYGTFRTKDLILQVYDAMAEATQTGKPYQTILDPPPGHGPRHPAYS